MTKGIQVVWPDANDRIDEIEYFGGIDVDNLDRIPAFSSVPTYWPRYEGGTAVDYNVHSRHQPGPDGQVHLIVEYNPADNPELADFEPWGTNTIILVPGCREGVCHWCRLDGTKRNDITWQAFDIAATNERPLASYLRSRRHAGFRKAVLSRDDNRCAITGEATPQALEAAHLVPARDGENDVPTNGVALRADLHRLFDAGLFTFGPDGRVVLADDNAGISDDSTATNSATHDYVLPRLSAFTKPSPCRSFCNENPPVHDQPFPATARLGTIVAVGLY